MFPANSNDPILIQVIQIPAGTNILTVIVQLGKPKKALHTSLLTNELLQNYSLKKLGAFKGTLRWGKGLLNIYSSIWFKSKDFDG